MFQVLYVSRNGRESSPDIESIEEARKYAKEKMKEPGVTEAVILKDHPTREGSDPIEYYGPKGHLFL